MSLLSPSDLLFCQVIKEKCSKFQYDEAELWTEFFATVAQNYEQAQYTRGYVYFLQSKFGRAASTLKSCKLLRARYILAHCLLKIGASDEGLSAIYGISSIGDGDMSDSGPFADFALHMGDVYKLRAQLYAAKGDMKESGECSRRAFEQDASLLFALRDAIFNDSTPPAHGGRFKNAESKLVDIFRGLNGDEENATWDSRSVNWESCTLRQAKRKRLTSERSKACHECLLPPHIISAMEGMVHDVKLAGNVAHGSMRAFVAESKCNQAYFSALRGSILCDLGQYAESREVYERVLSDDPFYPHHMEAFAITLWHQKDVSRLAKLGKHWRSDKATEYLSWIAYGSLFSRQGDYENAIRSYHKATEIEPSNVLPQLLCGYEYLSIEDYQTAEEYFSVALEMNPNAGKALLGLGIVYYRRNDLERSRIHLLAASRIRPEESAIFNYLGSVLYKIGETESALESIETAIVLRPRDPKSRYIKATILADQKKYQEALTEFDQLKDIEPSEPAVHIGIGEIYLKLGKNALALKAFTAAYDLDPSNVIAIEFLERYQMK